MKTLPRGLLFLFLLFIASCSKDSVPDEPVGPLPQITWVMSSGRFTIETGETIQLVPDIENLDETSIYIWTFEGDTIGHSYPTSQVSTIFSLP